MNHLDKLIEIEASLDRHKNPDFACSGHLKSAILAIINYERYMDGNSQFTIFEEAVAYYKSLSN